tara:strand:- start:151 stop:552 length:402 start_codon:yes stop_codon:yes gene_type:complete
VPVQQVSPGFKDISATFQINPINSDLIALKNENAIARSVRNLILTIPGERPFAPVLGSNVNNLLFENFDELTASAIRSEIETTLNNYEPRVEINTVTVKPNFELHEFHVTIQYFIVGMDVPEQELTFALLPTR